MGRWFRIDDDVIHDLKVQGLPDALFKAWINILCIASKNKGRLPSLDAIAFALRVDAAKATEILVKLVKAGLVDRDADGHAPHNWEGRQFITDNETSTERSRKHRAKVKEEQAGIVSCNNDATLQQQPKATLQQPLPPVAPVVAATIAATTPEAEAEAEAKTDTDQKQRKEGTREVALVPPDWPDGWFDLFWAKYPNKVDRAGSMRSLARVARKGDVKFATIMDGLDAYNAKTDDRAWCNPTTWINQARWDHRPPTVSPSNGNRSANTRTTGHDAILASATRKARELDQQDVRPRGDEVQPAGRDAAHAGREKLFDRSAGGDQGNHHGLELDAGRVLEGEVIAPDKDAPWVSGSGELV
jgi:DNA-binding MarR family transcriptional regulator